MLIENTVFGVIDKVDVAIKRLQTFEPEEGYYVAFSGGKDSVVLLDLVKKSGVRYDAHYNLTTVDPPELVYFIKTYPEVGINRPKMTMWQLIVKNGFPPTRAIRYCCRYLKEGGGKDRTVVTGVRWAESARRSKRKMIEACHRSSRKHYLNAIVDWSDADIWEYIKTYNVRYCHLYDEGWKRLGCVMCPMSSNMEKEAERWPKIKQAYLRAFDKAIKKHPQSSNSKQKTAQEMYDWWVNSKRIKGDPDQTILFE